MQSVFYQFKNKPYICGLKKQTIFLLYNHLIFRRNVQSLNNYKKPLSNNRIGEGASHKLSIE